MNPHLALRARRQRGLTLIELMVAMAIAGFLLGGLFSIVWNTKKTFVAQSGMAQLQDSERLAMTLIGDVVQQAGYFPNPLVNTPAVLPVTGVWVNSGQGLTGTTGGAAPGDTLTVRFLTAGGDGTINCTGGTNPGPGNLMYTNVFSVDAPSSSLMCALNGAAAVPLITGVQSLKILYGVKTNFAANNGAVDTYLTSAQMVAANWNNVISVQITLTFKNPLWGQPGQAQFIPFQRTIAVMAQTGVRT
jgi:type IV pilus assembly protein PilW